VLSPVLQEGIGVLGLVGISLSAFAATGAAAAAAAAAERVAAGTCKAKAVMTRCCWWY
jgi:hypothetical protein